MLDLVLKKEMQKRDLSSHSAAAAIGVSHTTILRALRGDIVDLPTVIKIANYLHIRPSELLNSMADASLGDQLAILISSSDELEAQLKQAVAQVKEGTLDIDTLKDVVGYALYKFQAGSSNVSNIKPDQQSRRTKRSQSREGS